MLTSRLQVNMKSECSPVATLKLYLVGSQSTRRWLNSQVLNIAQLEIVGVSDCTDRAEEEIVQLQPDVVIHATNMYEGEDFLLLKNIKAKLPAIHYVVLGNVVNFAYRVRYSSAGADMVLNLMNELDKIGILLRRMIYNLCKANRSATRDPLRVVNDSATKPAWNKLFSLMDESPDSLMFADQDLVLRYINPVALASFQTLEQFLPDKLERLVGQRIGMFHRERSIANKIISDPRNLPYNTQFIIGPKTFDLKVNSVYDDYNQLCSGIIALWEEIPEI